MAGREALKNRRGAAMKRERWLILAFVPALMLLNAFVVINYTGLSMSRSVGKPSLSRIAPANSAWRRRSAPRSLRTRGICADGVCCTDPAPARTRAATSPVSRDLHLDGSGSGTVRNGLLIAALLLAGVGSIGLLRNRRQDS
jgi:hypothetical protein